ncbi:MAG: ATP-dependent Clp protease adaptor ClpS [Pirellulaceae bacterium]|nr:ATP-dependent Clp protease adaptor ClpS [Pirellulaceae bacterium]
MSQSNSAVAEPIRESQVRQHIQRSKPQQQPRYHVILWDDTDHTFHYVIHMCQILFGHPLEKGLTIAKQVHTQGRAVLLTTTKEHAELKQQQIHSFGRDPLAMRCVGSMSATIEPER